MEGDILQDAEGGMSCCSLKCWWDRVVRRRELQSSFYASGCEYKSLCGLSHPARHQALNHCRSAVFNSSETLRLRRYEACTWMRGPRCLASPPCQRFAAAQAIKAPLLLLISAQQPIAIHSAMQPLQRVPLELPGRVKFLREDCCVTGGGRRRGAAGGGAPVGLVLAKDSITQWPQA